MARQKVVIGPDGVSFDELIVDGKSGFLFRRVILCLCGKRL